METASVLSPPAADSSPGRDNEDLRDGARAEPEVVGEGLLRLAERPFLWLERVFGAALPDALNPLTHTGAISAVSFLVAAVTGVLLLVWYDTSVYTAWQSVQAMGQSRFGGGLVRSLHRYSSDACMMFVVLHAVRLFVARRFVGARRLAWVTGILLIVGLWGVGWLGYWLVWDGRAQQVALGTARLMDALPIFADPLSRGFLTDGRVNTLLFFVVFFFHMLLPLGMAIPLWLHITRLSRPKFLTRLQLGLVVLGLLALASVVVPANLAVPAKMTAPPHALTADFWYLAPLWLTDRLGAWPLWLAFAGGTGLLISLPYWMQRKRAPVAKLQLATCNGCTLCYEDCPYDAIQVVPRTDGRHYAVQVEIDPVKCVGCGICAGSCDPGAIGLEALPVLAVRSQVEEWVAQDLARGVASGVAFVCSSSAGGALKIDGHGRSAQLPGYRVVAVPCAGWVHALTIERALKYGAKCVVVSGCGHGEVNYREGPAWTEARLAAERKPALRHDKADPAKVKFIRADAQGLKTLVAEARALLEGKPAAPAAPSRVKGLAFGTVAAASFTGLMVLGSDVRYAGPPPETSLVVSFKHPGQAGTHCRKVSAEEKAKQPPHMRRDEICERGRAEVQLRVTVDGQVALDRRYAARGLSHDGNAVAIERLPVSPGKHTVAVDVGDSGTADQFQFHEAHEVEVLPGHHAVVLFDRVSGFSWE